MKKLDESKVKWFISQKQKGEATSRIAVTMNVSTRWVKKLWVRYLVHGCRQDNISCLHGQAGARHSRTQGAPCSACGQDRGSFGRRTPARDHKGIYLNRYSIQHDTQDIEG